MASSHVQAQVPLKERIAALQQKPSAITTHPSAAPARASTVSSTGQPTTPPRGTLRDKINKFERKGGVPVPRGSFGMGAPPPADAGVTKSRELYGNRIPSVEKKPGSAPLPSSRSVSSTAPSSFPRSGTPAGDTEQAPLSPDITGESAPELARKTSVPALHDGPKPRRRLSVVEMVGQYNGLDDAAASSTRRDTASPSDPEPVSSLPTPPPSATAESGLDKLEPPPLKRAQSSTTSVPSVTSSDLGSAEIVSAVKTAITPTDSKPVVLATASSTSSSDDAVTPVTAKAPVSSTTTTSKSVPAPIKVSASPTVSEPSLTPVPVTTKSFSVVVHSKTTSSGTESRRASTDQSSSASESRRSVSGSQDGHTLSHIRSKRQFKHLAPQNPEPASQNDLSDLLKETAWFEATLGASFDIPSVTFDGPAPDVTLALPKLAPVATNLAPRTPPPSHAHPHSRSQASLGRASSSSISTPDTEIPPTPPPKSARTRRFFSLRSRSSNAATRASMSSDDSTPVATPPSPTFETAGPIDALSMRSARSGTSASLRLSPHRGIARAATFAERMLGRAGKTRSMVDEMPAPIPEQPFHLPSPVPERSFDISFASTIDSPGGVSFDFDAFPSVPQDTPQLRLSGHGKAATDGFGTYA